MSSERSGGGGSVLLPAAVATALATMAAAGVWSLWSGFERDADGVHRMVDEPRAVFGYFILVAGGLIAIVWWVRGARSRAAAGLAFTGAVLAVGLGALFALAP